MEQKNLAKILQHTKQKERRPTQDVFHFPQVSNASNPGQIQTTYSVDKHFIQNLEKDLGTNDAMANMLGPNPPPTPGMKVNIPMLQPPPQSNSRQRLSPRQEAPRQEVSRQEVPRPSSSSSNRSNPRPGSAGSTRLNTSFGSESGSSGRTPEKNKNTAHVRPFQHSETGSGANIGMGDVMGAASNWRSLAGTTRNSDLLAGQRTQLGRYEENSGHGANRGGGMNAMEINKIAQCSKMVPGMSGSEIRSSLEAVNWDTSIAVKNLKIDKLYRIGVATKPKCEKVLQAVGWDLEQAASRLLDSL